MMKRPKTIPVACFLSLAFFAMACAPGSIEEPSPGSSVEQIESDRSDSAEPPAASSHAANNDSDESTPPAPAAMDSGDIGDPPTASDGNTRPSAPPHHAHNGSPSLDTYCNTPPDDVDHSAMGHHRDPALAAEHMAAMNLLSPSDATHRAVRCGSWSNASVWEGGRIPDNDADVVIPAGIGLIYDLDSDVKLHFVRVDGLLEFATDRSTRMRVDTIIATPGSHFVVGTEETPLPPNVRATISIVDNGDLNPSVDPTRVSRGVVLHGDVSIRGTSKRPFAKIAQAPMAGETRIELLAEPTGWTVGDSVLIVGTRQNAGHATSGLGRSQDEIRRITAIQNTSLTLDKGLEFDHDVPNGYGLHTYAANMTRNVIFESEAPDGIRGHVMVMHSDSAWVRYASFIELGRTDRSRPVSDMNVSGRYPFHFHRSGTDLSRRMVVADGNVVMGGPGWGMVHHDSRAAVNRNVVYNVAGAGIVAEAGSEVGEWVGNLVTSITGASRGRFEEVMQAGKPGSLGEAYCAMSRAVYQRANVAANSKFGWTWEGRVGETTGNLAGGFVPARGSFRFDPIPLHDWTNTRHATTDVSEAGQDPDFLQIIDFRDNEAFAVETAVESSHRGAWYRPHTDIINEFINFTAWRVSTGIHFGNYTWDYTIRDSLFVGDGDGVGFSTLAKIENMNLVDTRVHNFEVGVFYSYMNFKGLFLNVEFKDVATRFRTNDGSQPITLISENDVDRSVTPSVQFDGDLPTLSPTMSSLTLHGRVTDSAGSYPFANYRHQSNPQGSLRDFDGYLARFSDDREQALRKGQGTQPVTKVISDHGALKKADGRWVTPVVFWVGDRVTGHNHPILVEFPLEGFDESFLEEHKIERFQLPSDVVDYLADAIPF